MRVVFQLAVIAAAVGAAVALPYSVVETHSGSVTNYGKETSALVITFDGTNKVYTAIEAYMQKTGSLSGKDWLFHQVYIDYPVSGKRTFTSKSILYAIPKRGREDARARFEIVDPTKIDDLK